MSIAEKLTTIAENEQKVYDSGKQAQYDELWDSYQKKGARDNYNYAFYDLTQGVWTPGIFKPKYSIVPTCMIECFRGTVKLTFDFVEWFDELGITFNTSKCTAFTGAFREAGFNRIGVIDMSNMSYAGGGNYLFYGAQAVTIDKLILSTKYQQFFTGCFQYAYKLENITISGTIGEDIDFQWSPLTMASIKSVIGCLSNDVTGKAASFNLTAVNNAFETSESAADGSESEEWAALIATKPNWTISLV